MFLSQDCECGDDYSPYHVSNQILDSLLELGWVRGSIAETRKAGDQSLVQEQRQLERTSRRQCSNVGNI